MGVWEGGWPGECGAHQVGVGKVRRGKVGKTKAGCKASNGIGDLAQVEFKANWGGRRGERQKQTTKANEWRKGRKGQNVRQVEEPGSGGEVGERFK